MLTTITFFRDLDQITIIYSKSDLDQITITFSKNDRDQITITKNEIWIIFRSLSDHFLKSFSDRLPIIFWTFSDHFPIVFRFFSFKRFFWQYHKKIEFFGGRPVHFQRIFGNLLTVAPLKNDRKWSATRSPKKVI